MKRPKLIIVSLTFLVIFACLTLYVQQSPLFEGFEAKSYDFRFKVLRGALAPHPGIALIVIDDASIAELGRFPWPRQRFAELVGVVSQAGARALFLDVLFPEPENPQADAAFAAALADSGRTYLAQAFHFAADGSVAGVTRSLPQLRQAAAGEAHINVMPDSDGVIRWTPLLIPFAEGLHPSMGLVAAGAMLQTDAIDPGSFEVRLGERSIPTSGDYYSMINYTGPPEIYPRYSFADVIAGRVPAEQLRDKLLLVGATALGVYDMRVTPFSHNTPGVEIHANIVDNLLRGDFIHQGGFEALADMLAVVLLGIAAAFMTLKLRHAISLPLVMVLVLGYAGFNYAMFLRGHWLSLVYPVLCIALVFSATAYLRFFFFDRKAREIRSMFSSYVSKDVVDRLVKDPGRARIGGENREISILFSDIQNYTGFSERLRPEEVVRVLNQYLAEMTHLIMDCNGTLDKFLGDGIMAYWGAPLDQPEHADLALDCALRMCHKMAELEKLWQEAGYEPLSIRIGINSGEVVVGNIGAEGKKMEYTAIGDNVNLASRLEGINKLYGTKIVVSEATRNRSSGRHSFRELDYVRVKGKERPLAIYELLAEPSPLVEPFETALRHYRQQDFARAREGFWQLAEQYQDRAARLYAERCEEFQADPPPPDWDGSFTALRK